MDLRKENSYLLLLALIGLMVFFTLFSRVSPTAHLGLEVNRYEAQEITKQYLKTLGHGVDGYANHTGLEIDNLERRFLKANQLSEEVRKRIDDHKPVAAWKVLYRHPERNERFETQLSADGELFQFEHVLPKNEPGDSLSKQQAEQLARNFLSEQLDVDWSHYILKDAKAEDGQNRVDYAFRWRVRDEFVDKLELGLKVQIKGGKVGGWERYLEFPQQISSEHQKSEDMNAFFGIVVQILITFIFVISIIVFVIRFRAREVSVRNALIFSLATLFVVVLLNTNLMPSNGISEVALTEDNNSFLIFINYFTIVFVSLMSTFSVALVWAGGESLTREFWPEKLKAFDAMFARRFFIPEIGRGILRGFALAAIQLGLWFGIYFLLTQHPDIFTFVSAGEGYFATTDKQALDAFMPLAVPALYGLNETMFTISFTLLFVFGLLKRLVKHTLLAVILTLLIVETAFGGVGQQINSRLLQIAVMVLVMGLTYLFYLRYDLLTAAMGIAFFKGLPAALVFLHQPDSLFRISGWSSMALFGGVLVYGFVASRKGTLIQEEEITPAYTQYITERERLRMELEIARRAQLRMLPQATPNVLGMDIAAFSEPAKEVGGDYYDFVVHDNKLGVIIGDVSGKGMSAALYMTLTKGFFQALAEPQGSPKDILCRLNRYFFQAAERNMFISLFYGVIDPIANEMVFARAGHNPIIVHRSGSNTTSFLSSPGIAIGLERGEIFENVIVEERTRIGSGDTLVFYTDGLTEGMNSAKEEFGEERLQQVIEKTNDAPAEQLLRFIRDEYKQFCGRQDQHDDLTCIVMKIA